MEAFKKLRGCGQVDRSRELRRQPRRSIAFQKLSGCGQVDSFKMLRGGNKWAPPGS